MHAFSCTLQGQPTLTRKLVPGASRHVAAVALLVLAATARRGPGRVSPPMAFADISRLVRPHRVAVVGASDRPGSLGYSTYHNVRANSVIPAGAGRGHAR